MRVAFPLALIVTAACGRFGDYDINVRSSAIVDGGVTWDELDGSVTGNGITNHAALAKCAHVIADSRGTIYALWGDSSTGTPQAYLRAFTSTWQSLAGSADGGGMSQGTGQASDGTHLTCPGSLAIDGSDTLYAVWQNYDGAQQSINLRVWSGTAWSGLGGSDVGGGIDPGGFGWWPSVIIDGSGRAVVAYEQSSNPYVTRWDNPWTGVSGAGDGNGLATSAGISFIPGLAPGPGSDLFAMWGEYTAQADDNLIRAAHWSQAAGWVRLGDIIGHTTTMTVPPQIVTYESAPVVYWADSDLPTALLHIMQWNGATWQALTPPVSQGTAPALRVDKNGHLLMSWTQQDAHTQIHAAWLDGSTWRSLDASAGSVSQATVDADGSDIAIDGNNRVTIIWRQLNDAGVQVLYGRRTASPAN